MPSVTQAERIAYKQDVWGKWFDRSLEESNGWWVGYCPMHDPQRQELGSGEYNFSNGTFRCMAQPRCHNKMGMSLSQLADQIVRRG